MNSQKIKPQTLKGFRDFLPETASKRDWLIARLKTVFKKFGFDPLESPALEYAETLLGKYGDEADKLLYLFKDRGDRQVGLRYDQTVPLARIVSQYQNLPKPFKRYQIQPVWRAENTQKGRYREFLQCDIDIVGTKDILADFEVVDCVLTAFKSLGFKKITILLNDRANFFGINNCFINSLDKLPKIGEEKVIEELVKKGLEKDEAKKLIRQIKEKPETENIIQLTKLLEAKGYQKGVDFLYQPTLARGLDYYTGIIYEVVSKDYPVGSLGGGGRYDNLIKLFTNQDVPSVGFAFGFDRIVEAMEVLNLLPQQKTETKVLVTIFSKELIDQSLKITDLLRQNNINTEIYLDSSAKLEKQLKYADKKGIPYVIIIGPDELSSKKMILKEMKTGKQQIFDKLDSVISYVNQS